MAIGDSDSARRHVALLRGINVGGKNRLPMRDLAALFVRLGCADVQTYIQSGNVVFTASKPLAARVPAAIERAIGNAFSLSVPVVVRSLAELRAVARRNPFLAEGAAVSTLHVAFLADLPPKSRVTALDPERSPTDRFACLGREVYLHCPGGVARTRLTTAWLDAALGTTSTVRNWNTVGKLIELAAGG